MNKVRHRRPSLPPLVFGVIVLAGFAAWGRHSYADHCWLGDKSTALWTLGLTLALATVGEAFFARRRGAGAVKTILWGIGAAIVVAFLMVVIDLVNAGHAGCLPT